MKNIVGIDLGTTYSAISKINSLGRPEISPDLDGARITASAIFFDQSGKTIVGEMAKDQAITSPERYAEIFKRDMGEPYYRGADGEPRDINGKKWSPVELSGILLSKIKSDFEKMNGPIDYAVITVPAYFDEKRRKATMDAAKLAKINITNIINEPTAAGLYYATQQNVSGETIVFDLGGGTFDVTLLSIEKENQTNVKVEIRTSFGDHQLGGKDFDKAIVNEIIKKYKDSHDYEVKANSGEYFELMGYAETIKKELSKKEDVEKIIRLDKGPLTYKLSRSHFEKMISPFFEKIEMLCESVLDEVSMKATDIKQVILVGGSSRIPLVSKTIKEVYGLEPTLVGNMDESVALGAALSAGISVANIEGTSVLDKEAFDNLNAVDVEEITNSGYGTLIVDFDKELNKHVMTNSILIPKNTKLPHKVKKTFYTIADNQTVVDISITEGNHTSPDRVKTLKNLEMQLPSGRPAGQPLEFTYEYDINQRMNCEFFDVNSGRREQIKVTITGDITENEDTDSYDDIEDFLDF